MKSMLSAVRSSLWSSEVRSDVPDVSLVFQGGDGIREKGSRSREPKNFKVRYMDRSVQRSAKVRAGTKKRILTPAKDRPGGDANKQKAPVYKSRARKK